LGYSCEQQSVNEQNQQIFPVIDLNKEGTSVEQSLYCMPNTLIKLPVISKD
jgi:hypothetical protein